MKITLFVNSAKTFFWHRKSLADALISEGHDVTILCSLDGEIERFSAEKYKVEFVPMSRKGLNPFKELLLLLSLIQKFQKLKPDLCHNFTIKCVIYGSLAAKFTKVPKIINTVTGLGIVFVKGGLLQRIVQGLYKFIFWYSRSKVIFQNPDDMSLFIRMGLLKLEHSKLIPGSGVNVELFQPEVHKELPIKVVFASRLLKSKGVLDLLEASLILKTRGIDHQLFVAGEVDLMSPDSLEEESLQKYSAQSHISFLGNVRDMASLLKRCHLSCFPSYYREGVPKFLLESAASGLPIITTDMPGCRDVIDGNGYLVPPKDPHKLSETLEFIMSDLPRMQDMGRRSRELAVAKFSESKVIKEILSLYNSKSL